MNAVPCSCNYKSFDKNYAIQISISYEEKKPLIEEANKRFISTIKSTCMCCKLKCKDEEGVNISSNNNVVGVSKRLKPNYSYIPLYYKDDESISVLTEKNLKKCIYDHLICNNCISVKEIEFKIKNKEDKENNFKTICMFYDIDCRICLKKHFIDKKAWKFIKKEESGCQAQCLLF